LFFAYNGITGTVHPIEVTEGELDEPEVVKKPVKKKTNERSNVAGDDQK
jgi:hypothetical protein